uniref:Uncharacterized protein n=1 Tax=Rhizophora mucronata TaxID=61149 RepID=A0A2P2KBH9_RHIMU
MTGNKSSINPKGILLMHQKDSDEPAKKDHSIPHNNGPLFQSQLSSCKVNEIRQRLNNYHQRLLPLCSSWPLGILIRQNKKKKRIPETVKF